MGPPGCLFRSHAPRLGCRHVLKTVCQHADRLHECLYLYLKPLQALLDNCPPRRIVP